MVLVVFHRVQALWLNGVFQSAEDHRPVAVADTVEQLRAWEAEQRAPEPYDECVNGQRMHLVYKPESPIHYCNAPVDWEGGIFFQVVTEEIVPSLAALPHGVVNVGAT